MAMLNNQMVNVSNPHNFLSARLHRGKTLDKCRPLHPECVVNAASLRLEMVGSAQKSHGFFGSFSGHKIPVEMANLVRT